jgi:hypothetical protein
MAFKRWLSNDVSERRIRTISPDGAAFTNQLTV